VKDGSTAQYRLCALSGHDGGYIILPTAADAAFKLGVDYLLRTQQEDGSWHVKSKAMTFQPYFESGFPHGYDQWISAAGSSWGSWR